MTMAAPDRPVRRGRRLRPAEKLAFGLETFLALNAVPVGAMIAARPDGSLVGLPPALLAGTPFDDFRIPGLVLALVIGGCALAAAAAIMSRSRHAARFVLASGCLLMGWIVVQVALIGYLSVLQPGMFALGLALALLSRRACAPESGPVRPA